MFKFSRKSGSPLRNPSISKLNTRAPLPTQSLAAASETAPLNDSYEQEADRVADEVTATGHRNTGISAFHSRIGVQQKGEQKEESENTEPSEIEDDGRLPDEPVLLKRDSTGPNTSPSLTNGVQRSSGSPLPASVRTYMEPRFGFDFSGVKVHTGAGAHQAASALGAAAFTSRNDIFFRNGRFSPATPSGRHLLAHELTHVVQQAGGSTRRSISSAPSSVIQRRAEVHVNLQGGDRVKVYRDSGSDLGGRDGFTASSGTSGHETEEGDLHIRTKRADPTAKAGRWGLRYFTTFHGEQGFHSHIAWPRRRTMCDARGEFCEPESELNNRVPSALRLIVDGSERSHGCVRLHEDNARALFNAVEVGTPVKIYRESGFRPSPFSSSGSGGTGRTHTVAEGDTLSEIAEQYGVTMEALRQANGIPEGSSHIEVGQELVIPDSSSSTQRTSRTHTVAEGETLSEIAEQYSISTESLRQANDIPEDSSHIEVGQELIIPDE